MNDNIEAIRAALNNPPPTPFFGHIGTTIGIVDSFVRHKRFPEVSPDDDAETAHIKLRIVAFFIVESGITYTELGAPIPLSQVTIAEHLELKKIYTQTITREVKRK